MDKYGNLVAKGRNEYLNSLEKIGWFNFSNNSKEEINKRLNETKENKYFVFCLYDLWFDTEGFEDVDAYKSLLDEIIGIIKIKDIKIMVEFIKEKNEIKIGMQIKNNIYEYSIDLEETEDWIDGNIIDEYLNNNILVKENINKKFSPIPPDDQSIQFVFMPEDIYNKAIEVGIIPEGENYFLKINNDEE